MGQTNGASKDVISFLKQQHQEVKALLTAVSSSSGDAKKKAFYELRRMLSVHETAEEEIVHPVVRKLLADGAAIVDARINEEKLAKIALVELETLDVDSATFVAKFERFAQDVVAHAEAEEREEFARLATLVTPERLDRMRKAVVLAEAIAPTRPHPGIESRAANFFAGPFASMADRVRDAVYGKS